jgi:FkbM family methyltransferase
VHRQIEDRKIDPAPTIELPKDAVMSTPLQNGEEVSRDDVVWCFRNLLGREPESEAAIDWHSRNNSFRALVEQFAKSVEFQVMVGGGKTGAQDKPTPRTTDHDLQAFSRYIDSNVRILRGRHQVRSLEVKPIDSSPLRLQDDRGASINVHLPNDNVIGLFALLNGHWDVGKPKFVEQVLAGVGNDVVLVDVGANVGLFSRQCLSLTPRIAALYAYEPHPENFSLLCRNLIGIQKVRLNNFGLANATSTLNLYLDPENSGNYSLNVNAMPQSFERTSVRIVRAGDEEGKWLAHGKPIFYKSDTQGSDEVIATSLSADFWDNVCGGIFELWRIPGKEYDIDRFVQILDSFDNKVFDKNPKLNVSSSEVMEYLQSTDHQFDDLLFWRS